MNFRNVIQVFHPLELKKQAHICQKNKDLGTEVGWKKMPEVDSVHSSV